jgi:molybdopterin-guanine dinucleotide biosynthesis adapter protein
MKQAISKQECELITVLIIAAVGISGSGKTTTVEYLISQLSSEGYKIGAIKHIHREGFTIDQEGTNTWRFTKAGSKITVAFSPEEIAIIEKTETSSPDDLDKIIKQLENRQLDIIFIEGFRGSISKRVDIVKIISAKNQDDLEMILKETVPPILAITGLIARNKPPEKGIPFINLPDEGDKLLSIVKRHLPTNRNQTRFSKIR